MRAAAASSMRAVHLPIPPPLLVGGEERQRGEGATESSSPSERLVAERRTAEQSSWPDSVQFRLISASVHAQTALNSGANAGSRSCSTAAPGQSTATATSTASLHLHSIAHFGSSWRSLR